MILFKLTLLTNKHLLVPGDGGAKEGGKDKVKLILKKKNPARLERGGLVTFMLAKKSSQEHFQISIIFILKMFH